MKKFWKVNLITDIERKNVIKNIKNININQNHSYNNNNNNNNNNSNECK